VFAPKTIPVTIPALSSLESSFSPPPESLSSVLLSAPFPFSFDLLLLLLAVLVLIVLVLVLILPGKLTVTRLVLVLGSSEGPTTRVAVLTIGSVVTTEVDTNTDVFAGAGGDSICVTTIVSARTNSRQAGMDARRTTR
jgi:hypothetical protein